MKSEERHEMETNVLAKWLVDTGKKLHPYSAHIVFGAVSILACWAIWNLSSGSISSRDQAGWDAYAAATMQGRLDSEALKVTAEDFSGKPVGELARVLWADNQLSEACYYYLSNKAESIKRLDEAEQAYELLVSQAANQQVRERAQFGYARTLEVRGEVDKAIEAYQEVKGSFSKMADARAERLEEIGAEDYSQWLATAQGQTVPPRSGAGSRPPFRAEGLTLPMEDDEPLRDEDSLNFDDIMRSIQNVLPDEGPDRYEERDRAASEGESADESDEPMPEETDEPAAEEAPHEEGAADESQAP